jgi:hypothetical protein
MSDTSKLVDSLAEKAIKTLIKTGKNECPIEGAGGLVVIKIELPRTRPHAPQKYHQKAKQTFTVCLDRR